MKNNNNIRDFLSGRNILFSILLIQFVLHISFYIFLSENAVPKQNLTSYLYCFQKCLGTVAPEFHDIYLRVLFYTLGICEWRPCTLSPSLPYIGINFKVKLDPLLTSGCWWETQLKLTTLLYLLPNPQPLYWLNLRNSELSAKQAGREYP